MTLYFQLLDELKSFAEEDYKNFHKKLLNNDSINVLGVRVPTMRKLAKKYYPYVEDVLLFPDDYYEVTFVKLVCASLLPYEKFISVVDSMVPIINNWACNDSFKANCIAKNKDDFVNYINKYLSVDKEFYQRYALTTLLDFYVEDKYLNLIYDSCNKANCEYYYVHMAVAWLVAEVLVKQYESGVNYLKQNTLNVKTHNKAIQKATESFRLTPEQKQYLKTLKR